MISQKSHAFEKQKENQNPIDVAVVSDDDISEAESPEKVAPMLLPKSYKPRNRAMVVRDFPFPPTRLQFQTPISHGLVGVAVRDFLFPLPRVQTPLSQDLVQPLLSDASEPTEESEYEAKESSKEIELQLSGCSENNISLNSFGLSLEDEGDMPKVVGLVDPSETSEHESVDEVAVIPDDEAIESPEKVAPVFLPKSYKPHNRVSAVRDYPIPIVPVNTTEESCLKSSSKNPEIVPLRRSNRAVAVRDFPFPQSSVQTPFSQYLVQPQLSDASEPTEESECEAKESSKEIELEWSVNTYGLVPGDSIVSMYNISLNSFGLSSEDGGIDIDSVGLVDRSETSELESMEEIASNFNTPDSVSFETKQLSHKLSDAQDPLDAQSDSEESCGKSNLKNPENLPLRRSNRLLKKNPNTTVKPRPKRKAKASMEAVPNCRRSKRIRDSKLSTTWETNKRKRSKH
ncbi:hypothetical protein HRI_004804300 [Hibiscus trionum]|uniref:Uncharacterized protein n=1 Tax=Hibiscus trionum TaxID=183268 RepID=A0A9W7MVT4_HIBTR|nr:hypothetical protein HRI_004804300 [Hibiscus trionum]